MSVGCLASQSWADIGTQNWAALVSVWPTPVVIKVGVKPLKIKYKINLKKKKSTKKKSMVEEIEKTNYY